MPVSNNNMTLTTIRQTLKQQIPFLSKEFKVKRIGIFGSYAHQQATDLSDIDLLVEFSEPIGWEYVDLHAYLEQLLGKSIDLVTPEALKPRLKTAILNSVVYL